MIYAQSHHKQPILQNNNQEIKAQTQAVALKIANESPSQLACLYERDQEGGKCKRAIA